MGHVARSAHPSADETIERTYLELAVKASGTAKGGVNSVRPVRGCYDNNTHTVCAIDAIHLCEQRSDNAFLDLSASIVSTARTYRIDFIEYDDARRACSRSGKNSSQTRLRFAVIGRSQLWPVDSEHGRARGS
jgi:hypothetical protein